MFQKFQLATILFSGILFTAISSYALPLKINKEDVEGLDDARNGTYIPIEPLISKSKIEVPENGNMVVKDIRTLSNAEKLAFLGDTRVVIQLAKISKYGELSYLTGKTASEKGNYVAFMDFANFFIDDIKDSQNNIVGRARVGVGLRLIARIKTNKKNINLGSILKIGFAASREEVTGELEVRAIGVTSKEIINLLPGALPNLDESSIQSALESMAAVKSKIYEADTSVQPRIMAVAMYESVPDVASRYKADH